MASCRQKESRALAVLLCVATISLAAPAFGYSSGISTLELGPQACNACHSGGQMPTVSLTGPTTVAPSSTNEYSVVITPIGSQTSGGFNISADFGTLAIGGADASQTRTTTGKDSRTEVTHNSRKAASGGAVRFSFLWTAPDSFTNAVFNAWGNAVNGNGLPTGDHAAFVSVTVLSSMPGPNPTNIPTATPSPTATPVVHDVVVAAVKPLNVTIAAGAATVSKNLSVKVTNADATGASGQSVLLGVTSDCPQGVAIGFPTFGGAAGAVFLKSGQSRVAKVSVSIAADAFTTLNHTVASRCAITFAASTSPASLDPQPSNNSVIAEVNVADQNDADEATMHESFVQSLAPLKLSIPAGAASAVKTIKPAAGNGDILPVPANPGDPITIVASDGDCPAGTVGAVTPDTVTVKGGKKQTTALTITVDAAQFTALSAKSPARCTAELTATGPVDPDPEPGNNTTKLVIDVIDRNDF